MPGHVHWVVHFALAVAAMVAGGVVAMERKGTPRHRRRGRICRLLMIAVNGTAFMM